MKNIKPNTLCYIRGVKPSSAGYECNGKIVTATKIKSTQPEGNIWYVDPPLHVAGGRFTGCADRYLFPIDDFKDELDREATDLAIENAFKQSLLKALAL